jgi:D-threonine aldolase
MRLGILPASEIVMHDLAAFESSLTPSVVVMPEIVAANIDTVIAMAGRPDRLRPHMKTHKTVEITRMLIDRGVVAHKCATLAEAEVLARAGAADVLVAYPLVGPNVKRYLQLKSQFPRSRFSSLVDHTVHAESLSSASVRAGITSDVMIDLDVGQHRTGVPLADAAAFIQFVAKLPGLRVVGLQAYDGHNHQADPVERDAAVRSWLTPVLALRSSMIRDGDPMPRIVVGGTPTFPALAACSDVPGLECSPGTFVLHDHGYGSKFDDLAALRPAAFVLTRIVSRPSPTRITLDAGTKAVASDPPLIKRLKLFAFPDAEIVAHNEEHMVLEVPAASSLPPGTLLAGLPGHICPTVALHKSLIVFEQGSVHGEWLVAARDRVLMPL